MECFVVFLMFAALAIFVSGLGVRFGPHSQARMFESLTRRFGGVYQSGGVLRRCHVRFRYGATWVTVSPGAKRGGQRAVGALLQWPDARLDLRIETRNELGPDHSHISTGDDDFDARFRVSGRPVDDIVRLLSDGVRWQIHNVSVAGHTAPLFISLRSGRLVIEKMLPLKRPEELHEFTQQCLELYDQAMLTRSEGIEFVGNADEAVPLEDPLCKICGEPILTDMVFCARCFTPHHLDCWQYNGLCSTYGCRETRYRVPLVAESATEPPEDSDRTTEDGAGDGQPYRGPQRPR